jgi:hypothetical protein
MLQATTGQRAPRYRLDRSEGLGALVALDRLGTVLRFHHVNLGVPVGGADAETAFLVDLLGYRRLSTAAPPAAGGMRARTARRST